MGGPKWSSLRSKLSPLFASSKVKMMFSILVESCKDLNFLLAEPAKLGAVVEMSEVAACFTTDIFASCAFGVQADCLKNPDAQFRKLGKCIFEPSICNMIVNSITQYIPSVAKQLRVRVPLTQKKAHDLMILS